MIKESQFMKAELKRLKKSINEKTAYETLYENYEKDLKSAKHVLAALAALDAAVPWIPDIVQEAHLLSVPIIIIAARTGNKSIPCTAPPDVIG